MLCGMGFLSDCSCPPAMRYELRSVSCNHHLRWSAIHGGDDDGDIEDNVDNDMVTFTERRDARNCKFTATLQLHTFSSHAEPNSSAEGEATEDASEVSKHHKDKKELAEIKKQLQQKEKELAAANGQISKLTNREKDLLQRQELSNSSLRIVFASAVVSLQMVRIVPRYIYTPLWSR